MGWIELAETVWEIEPVVKTTWGDCSEDWPKAPCRSVQVAVHLPPEG